jgi:hypothetical protein
VGVVARKGGLYPEIDSYSAAFFVLYATLAQKKAAAYLQFTKALVVLQNSIQK